MTDSPLASQGRTSRVSVSLSPDLHAELLQHSRLEGRSLSNLCSRLIADGVVRLRQAQNAAQG